MFSSPLFIGDEKGIQKRPDKLILARRKDEYHKEQMMAQKLYYEKTDLHSQFENSAESSIRRKFLGRKLEELRKKDEIQLEMRRERLRNLFNKDIETWREELKNMEPTKDSKLQQMRERVTELQRKREAERQRVVEEKIQMQKRRNCDELRRIHSKCMMEQVDEERHKQVVEKQVQKQKELEEKKYYDALWENERMKKVAREENENVLKSQLSLMTFQENQKQIQQLAETKKQEEELKQKEADYMKQILEIQTIAEEHSKRQKAEENRQLRLGLDQVNKAKIETRQKEIQKSLEEDLKWIENLMQQEANEHQSQQSKKEDLRNELLSFYGLFLQHKKEEEQRKKELETFYRQEENRVWALKLEKWNRENQQRAKLMQEVIHAREIQLAHKLEQARQELETKRKERETLEQWMRKETEKDRNHQEQHRRAQRQYHDILCSQIHENQTKKQREKELQEIEDQKQVKEQQEYQAWLQNEIKAALHHQS